MTIGEAVAVYAAFVGTASLSWQAFTWWRSGPRLHLSVMSDAIMIDGPLEPERNVVCVTVSNRGGRATTITGLLVLSYTSSLARLRRKATQSFLIPNPNPSGSGGVPYKIEPGAQWTGVAYRRDAIEQVIEQGHAYVGVAVSHSGKPILALVEPRRSGPNH